MRNYLFNKDGNNKSVFGSSSTNVSDVKNGVCVVDIDITFTALNSYIYTIDNYGRKIECQRGALSVCLDVVIRNDERDTLCRVWSKGFTVIESSDERGFKTSVTPPPPEELEIFSNISKRPPAMPIVIANSPSVRKRTLGSTLETPLALKRNKTPLTRFVAAGGKLHSFTASEILVKFHSKDDNPRGTISLIDLGGADDFSWKTSETGILTFYRRPSFSIKLPPKMQVQLKYQHADGTEDSCFFFLDTCSDCVDCLTRQ